MSRLIFALAMLLVFRRDETSGGASALTSTSIRRRRTVRRWGKSRSARKNRAARVYRRVERLSGAMLADVLFIEAHVAWGKNGMGACFVFCSGKSRLSSRMSRCFGTWRQWHNGLERERSRDGTINRNRDSLCA